MTTLELLPIQYHLDEPGLAAKGLTNYWGYNTLGFFCPDPRFAACDKTDPSAVADEFRAMVAALHEHGLEVVLDVVYNHTPEGERAGRDAVDARPGQRQLVPPGRRRQRAAART